jgi:hypothetical protein
MQSEYSISTKAKNLFLSLAESAQTLHMYCIALCAMFVEGPTWETIGLGKLDPREAFNKTAFPKHRKGIWLLKTSIIGNYCISCSKDQFSTCWGI